MKIILAITVAMLLGMGSAFGATTNSEVVVSAGRTVANSYADPASNGAFAVTLRRRISDSKGVSIIFLNEGNPLGWPKRDGIAVEGWWTPFGIRSENFRLEIGAGPYLYAATVRSPARKQGFRDKHGLALLISADVKYRISKKISAHVSWNRVMTRNSTDTDVFLIGVGYSM